VKRSTRYWRKRQRAARITRPPTFDPTTTRITWGKYGPDRTAGTFWANIPRRYLEWILEAIPNPDEQKKARLTLQYLEQQKQNSTLPPRELARSVVGSVQVTPKTRDCAAPENPGEVRNDPKGREESVS
jgi:hypothetical protein